ncbi:MAG: YkgJ family cysteine cluster protein [Kiritimatiellia bacterium]
MRDDMLNGFACTKCGNCCRVPGYVRLSGHDVTSIAQYLGLEAGAFTAAHTRLMPDRSALALHEQADGACAFLLPDGSCKIQPVKPQQCREFPYTWRYQNMASICEGWKE